MMPEEDGLLADPFRQSAVRWKPKVAMTISDKILAGQVDIAMAFPVLLARGWSEVRRAWRISPQRSIRSAIEVKSRIPELEECV